MTASLFWVASEHHTWQSPAVYAKGPGESSLMRWWVPPRSWGVSWRFSFWEVSFNTLMIHTLVTRDLLLAVYALRVTPTLPCGDQLITDPTHCPCMVAHSYVSKIF